MRNFKKWLRRFAFVTVAVALLLAVFHQYATYKTNQRHPMPGKRIDLGDGYELHYFCRGDGPHTIVIDAGLSGGSYDFEAIQNALADVAKVCVFDRGGYGWSDHIPGPRTSTQIVEEMHKLLHKAPDLELPIILAGHSFGGQNVRLYASTYPEDVEALVLIDALNSDGYSEEASPGKVSPLYHFLNSVRGLGLQRILIASMFPGDEPERIRHRQMISRSKTTSAIYQELVGQKNWLTTRAAMRHLDQIPVLIFSAGKRPYMPPDDRDRWNKGQDLLEKISNDTRRFVVENATHNIQVDAPEFVIREIREFLKDLDPLAAPLAD